MIASDSEAFLHALALRTFLKLWSIPNPYRAPGKEICDLVIVFGNDIIIFSDKACEFRIEPNLELGWERWVREAIGGSAAQLAGALRRLSGEEATIFADSKAKDSLLFPLPPRDQRRFHLVAIARPSHDPAARPEGWLGLTTVSAPASNPFEVTPLRVRNFPVHVFDGDAIDLLLDQLDTAADFLAYLEGRARAVAAESSYRFREADLLAAAIDNWASGTGLSPAVPPLSSVRPGAWELHQTSEGAKRSLALNRKSRTIDNIIEHFHSTYERQRFLNEVPPGISEHEQALRLLAAESRFARRIIVEPLYDILGEPDQSTPWASTVASPTTTGLRYVWMTYSDPPEGVTASEIEKAVDYQLWHQILVICGEFGAERVVGIALPNGRGTENVVIMRVFDGSSWTDEDRRQARILKSEGLFGDMVRTDYFHMP